MSNFRVHLTAEPEALSLPYPGLISSSAPFPFIRSSRRGSLLLRNCAHESGQPRWSSVTVIANVRGSTIWAFQSGKALIGEDVPKGSVRLRPRKPAHPRTPRASRIGSKGQHSGQALPAPDASFAASAGSTRSGGQSAAHRRRSYRSRPKPPEASTAGRVVPAVRQGTTIALPCPLPSGKNRRPVELRSQRKPRPQNAQLWL